VGLLETADGGTLFLDEVDALSQKAQVSLLRYLQEGEIRPIGSNKVKRVGVRVLSATNKDTQELIDKDLLRQDLMYRLDILNVTMPPLRKRGEDIFLLAQYYLAQLAMEENHPGKYLSGEVLEELRKYPWPGNVRELETTIRRAFLMTDSDYIHNLSYLFPNHRFDDEIELIDEELKSFAVEKTKLIQKFEKDYLHKLLEETGGNISRAATIAKKERRAFSRLMQKHGLDRKSYV
jgi:DNA-binding NtrC family response regulator